MGRFSFQQRSTKIEEFRTELPISTSTKKENIEPSKQISSLSKFKKKLRFHLKKEDQSLSNKDPSDETIMNDCDGCSVSTHKITNVSSGDLENEIEITICSDEEDLSRDGSAAHDHDEDSISDQTDEPCIFRNTSSAESINSKISYRSRNNKYSVLSEAPSAAESAYFGPPRFDWIDVETSAAIRVQAAFRRFKAVQELDRKGLTTTSMRKSRKKNKEGNNASYWDYIFDSSLFSFSSNEKSSLDDPYHEKKKERESAEAELRKFSMKQRPSDILVEQIEIVEDFIID